MTRVSPVHYINPSAISIAPNANGSANDLAVYIADGTKIKVYAPEAGVVHYDSAYQQWRITGRNRRLANSDTPYTVYARLSKKDRADGYLVFAPQQQSEGRWIDKYPYITYEGLSTEYYGSESADYWYVKLGTVSLPEDNMRTVDIDTGILGTDQYNNDWALNPDDLPLRVELGCTIDDEDAGPTPYIYWNKSVQLTAHLMEGWNDVSSDRFDHWEITRDTGDATADANWPSASRAESFASSGTISLSHAKGSTDDFNGAVSASFTVSAWGTDEEDSSTLVVLASATINIQAETVEKYDLTLSTNIVSYNPQSGAYKPAAGVVVGIRATDQRGDIANITCGQFRNAGLSASYAPVGTESWQTLSFNGGDTALALAVIGTSAFASGASLNVRLRNAGNEELTRVTIAYVRDGEDSKVREWIFLRSQTAITFISSGAGGRLKPALVSGGEVNPTGAASGNDTNKNQDGWVPMDWWDEPQGTNETYQYEYYAYRDYIQDNSSSGGGHWDSFSDPYIWSHFGADAQYIHLKGDAHDKEGSTVGLSGSVRINGGADVATHLRGLNLVTINRNTLAVVESINYDTYGEKTGETGVTGITDLKVKLNSLDNTVFTAFVSCDAIGWDDTLISLMQGYGMGDLKYTETGRYPFLFIGYKGLGKGNGITRMNDVLEPAVPVEVSVYVANGALCAKDGEDGADGEDAYLVLANPPTVSFTCDTTGVSVDSTVKEVTISMYKGADPVSFTAVVSAASHCEAQVSGTILRISTVRANSTFHDLSQGGSVTLTVTSSDGVIRTLVVPVTGSRQGPAGAGKMLYPAGQWEAKAYAVNGDAHPYVMYTDGNGNTRYYYLDAATAAATDIPGISDKWVQMSQVDVVFATFGIMDYGKMASAVFCGDWMYSQYGKLYSSETVYTDIDGTNYNTAVDFDGHSAVPFAWFNPAYPRGGARGTFSPNWAVNLKDGDMYASAGKVRFSADGSGFLSDGKIAWNAQGALTMDTATITNATINTATITNASVSGTFSAGTVNPVVIDQDANGKGVISVGNSTTLEIKADANNNGSITLGTAVEVSYQTGTTSGGYNYEEGKIVLRRGQVGGVTNTTTLNGYEITTTNITAERIRLNAQYGAINVIEIDGDNVTNVYYGTNDTITIGNKTLKFINGILVRVDQT